MAPQKAYASRFSNPNHPARQGLLGLLSGGKVNPSRGIIRGHGGRNDAKVETAKELTAQASAGESMPMGSTASDGSNREQVAWQATKRRSPHGPKRVLRQDVLYLMVVNMPSEEELERLRHVLGM